MVLADSSIWIDHLRMPNLLLVRQLRERHILIHDFVVGEIALGSLKERSAIVADLNALPHTPIADHDEVMALIERHALFGRGIGYVDAHLLAATLLAPGTRLWTRDRRLEEAADQLRVAAIPRSQS